VVLDLTSHWCHADVMDNWTYTEELRAQLSRPRTRHAGRSRDRDVARLLAPWRRHGGGPDSVVRGD
jgi:hypothetical protein